MCGAAREDLVVPAVRMAPVSMVVVPVVLAAPARMIVVLVALGRVVAPIP